MAQLGLLTNYQNYNSAYKDVSAIRTTRFDKNTPCNKSKKDNFQCSYFQPEFSKTSQNRNTISHNQSFSDCSYDSIKSESNNVSNILRWLRSLPSNFMIDDLDPNMNYCKLREKTRDLHRCNGNRSKSFGSSLKSVDRTPLEGKGIMFLGSKQKVNFVDKLDSAKMRSLNKKKKLMNKKHYKNSSVARVVKKCAKSDLSSNAKNQQSSMNNYQCQGILKNISRKTMTSTSQNNTIEKQIASNKRLLHSIKEIINTVDSNNRVNQVETVKKDDKVTVKKDDKVKKNEKAVSISSNVKVIENSTRKPFLKNPELEKKLDNSMRSTLKRYIHSNTWEHFQKKNKNTNGEPPVKKEKRIIPSLEPADSFPVDFGQHWNANPVLNNLRPFLK